MGRRYLQRIPGPLIQSLNLFSHIVHDRRDLAARGGICMMAGVGRACYGQYLIYLAEGGFRKQLEWCHKMLNFGNRPGAYLPMDSLHDAARGGHRGSLRYMCTRIYSTVGTQEVIMFGYVLAGSILDLDTYITAEFGGRIPLPMFVMIADMCYRYAILDVLDWLFLTYPNFMRQRLSTTDLVHENCWPWIEKNLMDEGTTFHAAQSDNNIVLQRLLDLGCPVYIPGCIVVAGNKTRWMIEMITPD